MQQRPCLLNTLLRAEDVQWSLHNGTADRLSIRGCPLQRFSQAQAQQCLRGKRLVFVGDSVTRWVPGRGWAGLLAAC